jgi:hypothetical protein
MVLYIMFFAVSKNWKGNMSLFVTSIVFTTTAFGIYYLTGLQKETYSAFNLSPGAACKGSMYLFQGDDETSKMCRDMAETPDGRCAIASFNCPNGYEGAPKHLNNWEYTSNSDSCWEGVKCKGCNVDKSRYEHPPDCDCGLCSMWM